MASAMPPPHGGRQVDPLVAPFLGRLDDVQWERLLTPLLTEHIQPIVRGVVRRRLGEAGRARIERADRLFDDVVGDALVRVIARLRGMTSSGDPIADLRAYVAVTAFHACDDYLRWKYPLRARLKNRLRYALTHASGLALWTNAAGDRLAGLAEWRTRPPSGRATPLQPLVEDPRAFVEAASRMSGLRDTDAFVLLPRLLEVLGQPIELDALVSVVAELWGVRDAAADTGGDAQQAAEQLPDLRSDAATEVERRFYLERLWSEIRALPIRQRAALLLNLRDEEGGGILSLFPITGVVTLRGLAEVLEISGEAFAVLWNELPLDDAEIAARLGLTRQQVINLRKSARERLYRRMKNAGF
jgi:DNA-directed RNA polymerase specialized sigma24 family protein